MINIIERLVTLADDMDQIRPGRDSLKILFLVICIESLNVLAGVEDSKLNMVLKFFSEDISDDDRNYILDNVKRSLADERFNILKWDIEQSQNYNEQLRNNVYKSFNIDIEITIFARIINEVRNKFVHEGNYWDFSFSDSDYSLMNLILIEENTEEYRLVQKKLKPREERIYDVQLSCENFRNICVNGFINIVEKYMQSQS